MDTPNKTSAVGQLSRTEILAATTRCLHDQGYDATTIRKIASMLDCAVGSIYRYFRDKHELLSIVTQQMLDPVAEAIEAGQSVEQTIRLYHQIVTRSPECYRLMFWLACQGPLDEAEATLANRGGRDGQTRLPRVVCRIVEGWGQLLEPTAAERCWAMVHGFILMGRDANACVDTATGMGMKLSAAVPATAHAEGAPAPPQAPTIVSEPAMPREPRIVIRMTEPPPPRHPIAASQVPAGDAKPVGPGEDVCLL